jgi:hypothetical protein
LKPFKGQPAARYASLPSLADCGGAIADRAATNSLSGGEISKRFWHARTPKSLLLIALFFVFPLSKINILFRYTSKEAIKLRYRKILSCLLIIS